MAGVIGIEIEPDTLVLTSGRDFKWAFENLDTSNAPINYPAGELYFELDTGGEHNSLQSVVVSGASGGTYKLGVEGQLTAPIDFYDAVQNPYGIDGGITDALEGLSNVGPGNVYCHPAQLYPVWEIAIKLNAGKNEVQQLDINGRITGGEFKLGYDGNVTATIPFGASDVQVKTALEALPGIGSGKTLITKVSDFQYRVEFVGALAGTNVKQILGFASGFGWGLKGDLFANVKTRTITDGLAKLTEPLVNVLNQTINDVFNSFEGLLGVDLDFVVNDALNARVTAKSRRAFQESSLITFNVDVTGNMIQNAINNIAQLAGLLETITVDFYWDHHYQVEFVNAKGNTFVPKMTADTTGLIAEVADAKIDIEVIEPGKARFTKWPFVIDGAVASLKVESDEVDKIAPRTHWQLVFLPAGEAAGGDPTARGNVVVQR